MMKPYPYLELARQIVFDCLEVSNERRSRSAESATLSPAAYEVIVDRIATLLEHAASLSAENDRLHIQLAQAGMYQSQTPSPFIGLHRMATDVSGIMERTKDFVRVTRGPALTTKE